MTDCRLRGNTYLLLLLRSSCPSLSSIEGWGATSNGITKPNMFLSLLQMIDPDHQPKISTLSQYFSQYMDGSRPYSKSVYPFNSPAFRAKFKMRMEDEYPELLAEMDEFCHRFLDFDNNNSMRQLVAGLTVAIYNDTSIGQNELFDCGTAKITKLGFKNQKEYILQPFLLSVWFYLVENKPDASEASDTYKRWTGTAETNSAPPITTQIGLSHAPKIQVSTDFSAYSGKVPGELVKDEFQGKGEATEQVEAGVVDDGSDKETHPQQVKQTVNNWYNAPGGIQAEHIENLVLPESWGGRYGK